MAFFDKSIEHAKESLAEVSREAIDHAGKRLSVVVNEGVSQAGSELQEVIWRASQEMMPSSTRFPTNCMSSASSPRTTCANWSIMPANGSAH